MAPGEFAVHYSGFTLGEQPYCTVLGSLPEAESYAAEAVQRNPALRCRIYSHEGLVGAPVREWRGERYVGEREITPRFRRWAGSILFFSGVLLFTADWLNGFRFSWPSLVGSRMLIPGVILLATEGLVLLNAKQKSRQKTD